MAVLANAPRGTQDILPAQSGRWHYVENTLLHTAELYGFHELRTPMFEATELFSRGVGDGTDVVQKEMYTFLDKGGRSITLRPEGTAGVVRAALQNGLLGGALPAKVCYSISCFRYEKPQAGRLREFHQFGAEVFGPKSPSADAELIAMAHDFFVTLGISRLTLRINSIGCPVCRAQYNKSLTDFLLARQDKLCPTCLARTSKNPMRVLDCKSESCALAVKDAPVILDFLCGECKEHFAALKDRLTALDIPYTVDARIVRGLDYYTKTVFEFVSENIGAQGTVLGGGRYDGLVETLGGTPTPALGFAMGLERLLLIMEAEGADFPEDTRCDIYIASVGEAASLRAMALCAELREAGFYAECDCMDRSIKAQMKYADKLNARYCAVLGDSELETGTCVIKNMRNKETHEAALETFGERVMSIFLDGEYNEIIEAGGKIGR